MIVQGILDFVSSWLAGLLGLLPPLPSVFTQALGWVQNLGATIGQGAAKFSPIVPWDTFTQILGYWLIIMLFWLAFLAVRFTLWIFGR